MTFRINQLTLAETARELEDDPLHVLVIDTETTGLGEADEVLQLSIINGYDRTVAFSHYEPQRVTEWPEAQRVHGITPEYVQGEPWFQDEARRIAGKLRQAHVVVGYNVFFDLRMLRQSGLPDIGTVHVFDVMFEYARICGERADWLPPGPDGKPPYRYWKLDKARENYSLQWDGKAHNSMTDARMTLEVLRAMIKEEVKEDRGWTRYTGT